MAGIERCSGGRGIWGCFDVELASVVYIIADSGNSLSVAHMAEWKQVENKKGWSLGQRPAFS